MIRPVTCRSVLGLPAAALLLSPALASPQEMPLGKAVEDARPVMTIRMGDMANFILHPKDAGIRRAMAMLDDRLAELPGEVGEMPPPAAEAFLPESLPTWLHLLKAPKSFAMGLSGSQMQTTGNPMVFGLEIEEASAEAATAYEAELRGLLDRMGAPVPPGLFAAEGEGLAMKMGMAATRNVAPKASAIVRDGALVQAMDIDVAAILGFVDGMMAQQGGMPPEASLMFAAVQRILGDLRIELAQTNDGTHLHTAQVMAGLAGKMTAGGILPEGGLTAEHLSVIPADATMAAISRMDLDAAFGQLNSFVKEMAGQMGEDIDINAMVKSAAGIDLQTDLFGALGDTYGYYSSMSTGGGGLSSMVFFASVENQEALVETKETLADSLNMIASALAQGYVAPRTWEMGDTEYTTLMFPGLPVPLELTMALTDGWMVLAATPQAAMGAVAQMAPGRTGTSLASHPAIAALADGSKMTVSYMDTAHYASQGYGTTCMLMAALSNGVRSPLDGDREPGPIVPPYAEFAKDIVPSVASTEVRGADLVMTSVTDGSTVVQTSMLIGFMYELLPVVLPVFGAAVGAEELGREFGIYF